VLPGSKILIGPRNCKTSSTCAATVVNELVTTRPTSHVPDIYLPTNFRHTCENQSHTKETTTHKNVQWFTI